MAELRGGNGESFHAVPRRARGAGTQFASLADQYGFIVIYPSATRSGSCFDVSSPGALTHNGNSDPVGIVSMVSYVEQHNNGDPGRVHVTEDTTLRYPNFGEEIKQWTNVLGASQTPVLSDQPQAGWTHTRYGNTGGMAPVEAYSIQGVGHSLPLNGMAAEAVRFFGLHGGGGTTTTTRPSTTTTGPTGGCRVTYVLNPWNTGLTA